jgi:Swiss Army Knife RNA repair-like protein
LKSPANRHIPLLLLDVDGVISLFGWDLDRRPDGAFLTVDGIPHYLSATAGEHLRTLAGHFELVWCTGWEERANEYLVHHLSLPAPLTYLTFPGSPGAEARHWKLDAIDAHAGPDRPLAWVDDDHDGCETWAAQRPGPTLLVTARPHEGITAEHVERLVEWAEGLDGIRE